MVTIEEVKKLRTATSISIMQCKKAFEEAKGDLEKAKIILQKKGCAIAEKKAGRTLGSGTVEAYIHNTKKIGAMVILACETDFVAKNEEFVRLARELAMQVVATTPKYVSRTEIDKNEGIALKEIFEREAKSKSAELSKKIIEGKFDAHFKEVALLEQLYIKDPGRTVQDLIDDAVQKFGERIKLIKFTRYALR